MPKSKVFVIHGMGKYADGWWNGADGTEGVLDKIKKIKRHDKYKMSGKVGKTLESFADKIDEWIELTYDDESEKIRKAPQNDSELQKLTDLIKQDPNSTASNSILDNWQKEASEVAKEYTFETADGFIKDNIWDVFLCSMKLTRHYLALGLAEKIITEIQKDNNANYSILAISLGTALIQDVVHLVDRLLAGNRHQFKTICLIADFSRTLTGDILVSKKPYSEVSKIYPSNDVSCSVCQFFISARHLFDPLSYLAKTVPGSLDSWSQFPKNGQPENYRVYGHSELKYVPDRFKSLDIKDIDLWELGAYNHSIVNYFSSPLIHLPFFVTALGRNPSNLSDLARVAHDKFEKQHGIPDIIASLLEANASDSEKKWLEAAIKLFYNLKTNGSSVSGSDVHV